MARKILHIDLDAFFCSVEEIKDPQLVGKAFAVGGQPGQRGVVSSCSYAARQFGVRSAMPTGRALALCPGLILVSGRHSEYGEYSDRVMAIFHETTPLVEEVSIDEAFLDVSDLPQSPELIARQIQERVRVEVNLPCSIGAAGNKLVAKIATDIGKAEKKGSTAPRAIKVVQPGKEAEFLAPLPVQAIWGVGAKTAAHLNDLGLHTIGDVAASSPADLKRWLGKTGEYLARAALGVDDSQVHASHGIKSISQESTFAEDTADIQEITATFRWMADKVARRLRQKGMSGSTVCIKVRLADFSTFTRQEHLPSPTNLESIIFEKAMTLFNTFWKPGQPIRLLGVGVSELEEGWHQMALFEPKQEKEIRLHQAMDEIREKFGKTMLQRGKTR
ncbi:MAG: DNA polymerase IV [Anaerolinea sp.]|nr:DNA polymerase IV [Anaerolinea sp.]